MRVIRLTLAYDGTDFRGWAQQRDPAVRTVEGSLDRGPGTRRAPATSALSVGGRTDAGVHARGQVASFVTSSRLAPERIQKAVNGFLAPGDRRRGRALRLRRASMRASRRRHASTATSIDTGPCADPFTARFVWHRAGGAVDRAGCARRLGIWWGSTTSPRSAGIPGAGKPTVRHLQRVSVARDGSRVTLALPRERVPASDGPHDRRNARAGGRGHARARRTSGRSWRRRSARCSRSRRPLEASRSNA